MVNWNDMSQLQRRISETSVGVQRREAVLKELSPELGQVILEIGCGGGQLLKEVGLRVGPSGKVIGLDISADQITAAKNFCEEVDNIEFFNGKLEELEWSDHQLDSVTSTQTLEYVEDLDSLMTSMVKLMKPMSKFVNYSTLWDYFRFHGPEDKLNQMIHTAAIHQAHLMLPSNLLGILNNYGFHNVRTTPTPFFFTKRDGNSFANFTEMNLAKVALQNGVAEETVSEWRRQLKEAEKEGRFSFTVIGVVTAGYLA